MGSVVTMASCSIVDIPTAEIAVISVPLLI